MDPCILDMVSDLKGRKIRRYSVVGNPVNIWWFTLSTRYIQLDSISILGAKVFNSRSVCYSHSELRKILLSETE